MAEVAGVVQEVRVKDVSGGRKSYDVVVGGQGYGAGLYAPKTKIGDYVKFEVDESRGYKNIARGTLKVSANKAPPEAIAEAAITAPKASTTGGTFDSRQDAISRQAASNTAIAFMQLLHAAGALPTTATKGKGQEVMEALLHKYEQEFYERNTGIKYKSIAPDKEAEVAEVDAPVDDKWE